MAKFEIEKLLANVSDAEPCGKDEWFNGFDADLGKKARAKEDANWPQLRETCVDLIATRFKDLRSAMYLTLASLEEEGVIGFSNGIQAVRMLLEKHWENLHPRFDPTKKPAKRVQVLEWMVPQGADELRFRPRLRQAPLTGQNGDGKFSLQDLAYASGKESTPPGVTAPTIENVEAAFSQTDVEDLKKIAAAATSSIEHLKAIATFISTPERAGPPPPAFSALVDILTEIQKETSTRAAARAGGGAETPADQPPGPGGTAPAVKGPDGAIRSDADVKAAIDRICDYYRRTQPSNPIPLLLERAKRWVGTGFLDLVADLNLDSKDKLDVVLGIDLKSKK